MYYVYELVDPRDESVFYVGKGKGYRIDDHEREAVAGRVSRKCERIRDIIASGHIVGKRKVKLFSDEQEAYDFEADLIDEYGLASLTNAMPGMGRASGRPTLAGDRLRVRCAAFLLRRTVGGRIAAILINGERLDLAGIADRMKPAVAEIAQRRGVDWVNGIALRHKVEFALNG